MSIYKAPTLAENIQNFQAIRDSMGIELPPFVADASHTHQWHMFPEGEHCCHCGINRQEYENP